jgi:hypothetical protein
LIDREQTSRNRALTRDEKQAIMQGEIDRKVTLSLWFKDSEISSAIVSPDDYAKAYVPIDKVPAEATTAYLNLMRSEGRIPITLSDADALRRFQDRIQRAWALRSLNRPDPEVLKALRGQE